MFGYVVKFTVTQNFSFSFRFLICFCLSFDFGLMDFSPRLAGYITIVGTRFTCGCRKNLEIRHIVC